MGSPLWVANIRQLLAAKEWSQLELAEKCGIDKNTLTNNLTGKTDTRVQTLEAIAKALGVPLYRLFVDERQAAALDRHDQTDAAASNEAAIEERLKRKWLEEQARQMGLAVITPPTTGPVEVPKPVVVKRGRKAGR